MKQSAKNGVIDSLLTLIHARWWLYYLMRFFGKVCWKALLKP